MDPLDMADPQLSRRIAQQMAKLHGLVLPKMLQPFYTEPGMWPQLWAWYEQASALETAAAIRDQPWGEEREDPSQLLQALDLDKGAALLRELQTALPPDVAVAFCHNDLLAANIMVNDTTGEVALIDFEYGGLNYRAFDIANHFNEWAGGTDNGTPDYSKFPTPVQQRNFCEAYLLALDEGVVDGVVTEAALATLMREANLFVQVNHWYWGCWAVNQARTEGLAVFPYLTYATSRLTQFKAAQKSGSH
jgi:thiamine kinase-like enzyme